MQIDDLLDRVAGGAGDIADDRPLESQQAVEQAGLPHVGLAENHGPNSFTQHPSLVGGGEQGIDHGEDRADAAAQQCAGLRVDVLLGEIDPCFEMGECFQQLVAGLGGAPAERALQLAAGGAQREPGLRGDQIHDALCLS